MEEIPRGARPQVKNRSTPDLEALIVAVAQASRLALEEICSRSKKKAIVLAKEALILVANELGATNIAAAKRLGVDSSVVSRRLDSGKTKMKDSSDCNSDYHVALMLTLQILDYSARCTFEFGDGACKQFRQFFGLAL